MSALNKLQQAFAEDLWGNDLQHLQGLILDGRLPAGRLLQVYRNNFRTSLTEALIAIYPVLEQLVGNPFFAFLADRYLRAHPSRSGNLHRFGAQMAEFISRFQPASTLPYLSDVARLEWAYHTVFHAPAADPFVPRMLQSVTPEQYPQLHFNLGPACRRVDSPYPILRIWQVNQPDYPHAPHVALDRGGESVLVVRPQLQVELRRLDLQEACFLQALDQGLNLGDAVDRVLRQAPTFDLQSVLAKHLSSGALVLVQEPPGHTPVR